MRYLIVGLLLCTISSFSYSKANLSLYDLTVDDRKNPIGVDNPKPRFTWKIQSTNRSVSQIQYELRVALRENDVKKGKNLIWHSGTVNTEQSLYIRYGGPDLRSKQRYYWQVRIRDNQGHTSAWSAVQHWETGLLDKKEWSAKWIEAEKVTDGKDGAPPLFFKDFEIPSNIESARLYVTAHGIYDVALNGQKISEQLFNPGWTSYHKRLQYQTYDVTSLLKKGQNSTLVTIGDGWYRGFLEWGRKRNFYGKEVALLYQLEVKLTNGSHIVIHSDDTWKSSFEGPIRSSSIYNGETVDTRVNNDVSAIKFADGVRVMDYSLDNLVAQQGPPILKHEYFDPVEVSKNAKGELIVDFGQNLVGWVRLNITGKSGDTVTLHHAEVLDKEGDLYIESLRAATQENKYVLNGKQQVIEPSFTFQGFRYVRISGAGSKDIDSKGLKAIAIYSAMKPTGSFESSNPLINQLQSNIQWGQKGNFLDIPTDCPQRDERLGWTGDAQVFFNTAAYNMDVNLFFKKWMHDLKADQYENGNVPAVIPITVKRGNDGSAGWADAATIIPWQHFMVYGDTSILIDQYQSMRKWVEFVGGESKDDVWRRTAHYGDWLFYTMADDRDGKAAITDKTLIAQAFYAASIQNLIHAAQVLGKDDEVVRYSELLERIKKAFLREFVTPSGRLVSNTQTAYILALNFDLLPEDMRAQAAQRLVDNIKLYKNHITTGFLGTPYINNVLTRFGHDDVAYALLLQEKYPSWLYPVTKGATTIWERWDGIKPDGSFQTPSMNSFNHYAYGAVGDWMYKNITGIKREERIPSYKKILVAPRPGGGLSFAKGELESPYGKIVSEWAIHEGKITIAVTIPPNTTGTVVLPNSQGKDIHTDIASLIDKQAVHLENSDRQFVVGSGSYRFEYEWAQ